MLYLYENIKINLSSLSSQQGCPINHHIICQCLLLRKAPCTLHKHYYTILSLPTFYTYFTPPVPIFLSNASELAIRRRSIEMRITIAKAHTLAWNNINRPPNYRPIDTVFDIILQVGTRLSRWDSRRYNNCLLTSQVTWSGHHFIICFHNKFKAKGVVVHVISPQFQRQNMRQTPFKCSLGVLI